MGYPWLFSIETMLGCNLRCIECAIGANLITRKYGYMSLKDFTRIARKILPYCRYAYMHLWGEPMINPEIISMLKLASTFTRTNISTNANNLSQDLAKQLIFSGVSDIIVSIDGMTQETYQKYRRGGDVSKVLHGLAYLVHYNKMLKTPIAITPQFIVFEHNKHEMSAFAEFCAGLGLQETFKAPYLRPNSVLKDSGIPMYIRPYLVSSRSPAQRCRDMQQCNVDEAPVILLDGTVVPCCYDHNGTLNMGNIFSQSFESIWNSQSYIAFRNDLKSGKAPDFCLKNCLLY